MLPLTASEQKNPARIRCPGGNELGVHADNAGVKAGTIYVSSNSCSSSSGE